MLFCLEHAVQDGTKTRGGGRRIVSKRVLYVEMGADGSARHLHYAPYLDYRPLGNEEPTVDEILQRPECSWLDADLEHKAREYAIVHVVPDHIRETSEPRREQIVKTETAVKERLSREIAHWTRRAEELKLQEQAGKTNARLNSNDARRRAANLQARLEKRISDLQLEAMVSALPPNVVGGALVVPVGLLAKMAPDRIANPSGFMPAEAAVARARSVVMDVEHDLGFEPINRAADHLGYDIESKDPGTGSLRFIDVRARAPDAATIAVARNEILYSRNKPDDFILAIVEFKGDLDKGAHQVHYVRNPFDREAHFGVSNVNYNLAELLGRAETPG